MEGREMRGFRGRCKFDGGGSELVLSEYYEAVRTEDVEPSDRPAHDGSILGRTQLCGRGIPAMQQDKRPFCDGSFTREALTGHHM